MLTLQNFKSQIVRSGTAGEIVDAARAYDRLRTDYRKALAAFPAALHINQAVGLKVFQSAGWINSETRLTISNDRQPMETHESVSFTIALRAGGTARIKILREEVIISADGGHELAGKLAHPYQDDCPEDFEPAFHRFIEYVETLFGAVTPHKGQ